MDLLFALVVLVLIGAPIGLARSVYLDRSPGFGSWRGDPWPRGVQEEELDHAWGHAADAPLAPPPAPEDPAGPTVVDLRGGPDEDMPDVTRLHPSIRRAA
jgi:hypothetical protein